MADQQAILRLALKHAQDNEAFREFAKDQLREQSKGRTIFSTAAAVLKAAPEDSLDGQRDMLRKIMQQSSSGKFHGVKMEQLQCLISLQFGEKDQLLAAQEFGGFDRKDLLGYLEICRRCFWVVQAERPMERPTDTEVTRSQVQMTRSPVKQEQLKKCKGSFSCGQQKPLSEFPNHDNLCRACREKLRVKD